MNNTTGWGINRGLGVSIGGLGNQIKILGYHIIFHLSDNNTHFSVPPPEWKLDPYSAPNGQHGNLTRPPGLISGHFPGHLGGWSIWYLLWGSATPVSRPCELFTD